MLTEKQILALNEFYKMNDSFTQGDAWCYDKKRKILYSPVTENKLNRLFENLPKYAAYKIITLSNVKKIEYTP